MGVSPWRGGTSPGGGIATDGFGQGRASPRHHRAPHGHIPRATAPPVPHPHGHILCATTTSPCPHPSPRQHRIPAVMLPVPPPPPVVVPPLPPPTHTPWPTPPSSARSHCGRCCIYPPRASALLQPSGTSALPAGGQRGEMQGWGGGGEEQRPPRVGKGGGHLVDVLLVGALPAQPLVLVAFAVVALLALGQQLSHPLQELHRLQRACSLLLALRDGGGAEGGRCVGGGCGAWGGCVEQGVGGLRETGAVGGSGIVAVGGCGLGGCIRVGGGCVG